MDSVHGGRSSNRKALRQDPHQTTAEEQLHLAPVRAQRTCLTLPNLHAWPGSISYTPAYLRQDRGEAVQYSILAIAMTLYVNLDHNDAGCMPPSSSLASTCMAPQLALRHNTASYAAHQSHQVPETVLPLWGVATS
ncbi:unnamed protein product [Cercospora beticola]|nr:unnamed protein product [Cercospora beticola]